MSAGLNAVKVAASRTSAAEVALRLGVALPGGYAFAWAIATAGSLLLFRGGVTTRADAVLIATNLGLLAAPGVVVWAFATRRPWRLAALAGAAAALGATLTRLG